MSDIKRAIWQFNNNMTYKHDNLMNGTEYTEARSTICRLLVDALEREKPRVLTWEQLNEWDGKPVYIVYIPPLADHNGWLVWNKKLMNQTPEMLYPGLSCFLAYEYEPKEAKNEQD